MDAAVDEVAELRGYLRGYSDGYKAAINFAMKEIRRQMGEAGLLPAEKDQ